MDQSKRQPSPIPLSRGELEIELGRLALVLGNAASSERAFAAKRAGLPHPVVGPFLDACAAVLQRTQPRHRAFAVRRLDRMATAAGLGFIGLDIWLGDDSCAQKRAGERDAASASPPGNTRRPATGH